MYDIYRIFIKMNQTQKTEWITELAACRFKVLMRNHIPTPYKSAADQDFEKYITWRTEWRSIRDSRNKAFFEKHPELL